MVEVGSAVKNFKKGDYVVAPFTISWYVHAPPVHGLVTLIKL